VRGAVFGGNFTQMRKYSNSGKIGKVECRKNNTSVLKGYLCKIWSFFPTAILEKDDSLVTSDRLKISIYLRSILTEQKICAGPQKGGRGRQNTNKKLKKISEKLTEIPRSS
jgi:hypothetical protein